MAWRFSAHDKDGPWAWTKLRDPAEYKRVVEKLHHFETMSLDKIREQRSHRVSRDLLVKEAKERLVTIKQDDIDELMSFRIAGRERVWCIQSRNIMKILWWDPRHEVCPSQQKHT